jgi:hypothetical protein
MTPAPRLGKVEGNQGAGDAQACGCPRAKFQLPRLSRVPHVRHEAGGSMRQMGGPPGTSGAPLAALTLGLWGRPKASQNLQLPFPREQR